MELTLFTRKGCGKCIPVLDALDSMNLSYTLAEINTDLESKRKFNKHRFKYVPSLIIKHRNKTIEIDGIKERDLADIIQEVSQWI